MEIFSDGTRPKICYSNIILVRRFKLEMFSDGYTHPKSIPYEIFSHEIKWTKRMITIYICPNLLLLCVKSLFNPWQAAMYYDILLTCRTHQLLTSTHSTSRLTWMARNTPGRVWHSCHLLMSAGFYKHWGVCKGILMKKKVRLSTDTG